jgi:chaperonin GroEL
MERILITGKSARDRVVEGANKGATAVGSTLGPFGTNALMEKGTRITNDGLKIAQEITLEDEVEELGWRKMKEAMAKSNDQVGDGSTTIVVLAQAILKDAVRLLGKEGVIGQKMTTAGFLRKLHSERDQVLSVLADMATPITTEEELINSATVSVEDAELGRVIGSAQWELGPDGYLLAEEVPETVTSIERIHGVKIDNGFGASFIINNQEKQMLEVDDAATILTDHTLQNLAPLEGILNQLLTQKRTKVVIVARGFSDEAIKACAKNIEQGFQLFPINAPYTDSKEVMRDLAAVLGGQFMDNERHALEDMQLSDVGFASKVRARRFDAVLAGDGSQTEKIQARLTELKDALSGSLSDFEKKHLESRIAQLEHGFAVVKVGAESDTERKRKFDKVEDAVNAVRAALQEGTVPGAGIAFKEIAESLPDDYILKRPLNSLHEQIMANAPDDFVIEDWVRDPAKVLRIALEQAVSVAGDLATVSVAVSTKKPKYNAYVSKEG